MARLTGLRPGTPVAIANVDAHAGVPAAGIAEAGKMLMIMGTSICHMLLGTQEQPVPGMCGVVEDGILPGFFGYEAGQSGAGDILAWFVRTFYPKAGAGIHRTLEPRRAQLKPGESGLLALDWWNGNRSVLVDTSLSGLLLGRDARYHARGHLPRVDRVHRLRHPHYRGELRAVRNRRQRTVRLRRDGGEEPAADADFRRRDRAAHQARPLLAILRPRRRHVRAVAAGEYPTIYDAIPQHGWNERPGVQAERGQPRHLHANSSQSTSTCMIISVGGRMT